MKSIFIGIYNNLNKILNNSKNVFSQNGDFIIIDIGTHSCGEIKSFINSKFFFFKLSKRIIKNLYKKKSINLNDFKNLLINHFKIKKIAKKITLILVEPNFLHFDESPYKLASMVLPVAIKNIKENDLRTTKLFFANNDPKSAGNSIFSSKGNVNKNNFRDVLTLSTNELIDILRSNYLHKTSKIILRINCEGMEDEIIYDFKKYIPNRLKGIMGSLKDVRSIKGNKDYSQLMRFIDKERIKFIPFSDDIETWAEAHSFLFRFLNE